MSTWEQILIPLKVGFRDFNEKGDVSLPKLLVAFNGGLPPSLDLFGERFSVTLSRSGALRAHYFYTVGYETKQPERY